MAGAYRPRFSVYGAACAELIEVHRCNAPSVFVEQKHGGAMVIAAAPMPLAMFVVGAEATVPIPAIHERL